MSLRNCVYVQLEPSAYGRAGISVSNVFMLLVTLAALTSAILSTEVSVVNRFPYVFQPLEIAFGLIFLVEYLLRIWIAPEGDGDQSSLAKRWSFIASPSGIFDAIVIIACQRHLLRLRLPSFAFFGLDAC
jgi:voltage-gated potassium channel